MTSNSLTEPAANSETLNFENARAAQALYVNDPQNLRRLEERFGVKITTRDGWIKIDGLPDVDRQGARRFPAAPPRARKGPLHPQDRIQFRAWNRSRKGARQSSCPTSTPRASRSRPRSRRSSRRSLQQKKYVEAVKTNDLIFGVGPAGTGKTFLAMAMAVAALKNEEVTRIVLTRPAVEAGEALGFLPGDLQEKIFPYLRPLYDALNDMLENEEIQRYMDKGIIEIAPLAYMRGRTLSRSFIILDEAQNTTTEQMFMFLTRLGQDSKCVVTGDPSQVDLPHNRKSGLIEAMQALHGTEGIFFTKFDEVDVIRHELVQRIIRAYKAHRGEKDDQPDAISSRL